ncbi:MAG TPA: HEPN domain-containing protein [Gemmataceae bacterium]|jgi:uncharacterized protein (UPF0332 family)|nr:HEPN domain-containing protein [Gemmataceae bacterium]
MKSRDFLTLAQALLKESTEVAWRSAVSRAYYAAFHVARELLQDLGFVVPKAERAHAYLWRRLSNCGDPRLQAAGHEINDLRGDRNEADYDLRLSLAQTIADGQVRTARKIIDVLAIATAEPMRSAILDAMKVYERDILKEMTWQPPKS